jgi:hypothetical protein
MIVRITIDMFMLSVLDMLVALDKRGREEGIVS